MDESSFFKFVEERQECILIWFVGREKDTSHYSLTTDKQESKVKSSYENCGSNNHLSSNKDKCKAADKAYWTCPFVILMVTIVISTSSRNDIF